MAASTSAADVKPSAWSTQLFWCSRAYCAGMRIRRCRSRKAGVTFGERFSLECHQKTAGSSPSASVLTDHNGPVWRRPTVETTSISGSSTEACPASRLLNSSSSLAQPTSS